MDVLGTDMTVVNAARVSFGKRKGKTDPLDADDIKLLSYLAKNKHYSPFRHVMVQFHIKAPEFVMRQLYRHVVGIESTSNHPTKDHAWNEISGRYTEVMDYYSPLEWRKQSESNKQGSAGLIDDQKTAEKYFEATMMKIFERYHWLLNLGVAREQARIILPLNIYTEVIWTASFQAIANFIELRTDAHAQKEIRDYADCIERMMLNLFPETMKAWFDNK
jgi:thymidylate synthase (FAD)